MTQGQEGLAEPTTWGLLHGGRIQGGRYGGQRLAAGRQEAETGEPRDGNTPVQVTARGRMQHPHDPAAFPLGHLPHPNHNSSIQAAGGRGGEAGRVPRASGNPLSPLT